MLAVLRLDDAAVAPRDGRNRSALVAARFRAAAGPTCSRPTGSGGWGVAYGAIALGYRPTARCVKLPNKRTRDHPSHDHCAFIIEPDEVGRTPPDSFAHWTIIAVDHPLLGLDSLSDPADEFLRVMPRQIAPFRLPIDCIEFDMRQLQMSCNSACQSGFPGA